MEITKIINYEEIVERWKDVTEKCKKEHSGEIIDRYIKYSEESLSTPQALFRAFYNDSFINLYFRNLYAIPEDKYERERVELYNFPLREMKSTYYCKIEKPEENERKLEGPLMAIISGQEGMAEINYVYGTKNAPKKISALFTATNNSKQYQKKIDILQDKQITDKKQ